MEAVNNTGIVVGMSGKAGKEFHEIALKDADEMGRKDTSDEDKDNESSSRPQSQLMSCLRGITIEPMIICQAGHPLAL